MYELLILINNILVYIYDFVVFINHFHIFINGHIYEFNKSFINTRK